MHSFSDKHPAQSSELWFDTVLEAARRFLLAHANADLPSALRAKGGASDLVQETLAAAHRGRAQFRGQTVGELRTWLRAILSNELKAFRRAYEGTAARDVGREVPLADPPCGRAEDPVLAELVVREERDGLATAVARLDAGPRAAVTLRLGEGLTFAQIGARLGCSEEAARKSFTRALSQLRGLVPADAA